MYMGLELSLKMISLIGEELEVHDLDFEPSIIQTPQTVTSQIHWLSTTDNTIDLTEKTPASELRTQARTG